MNAELQKTRGHIAGMKENLKTGEDELAKEKTEVGPE